MAHTGPVQSAPPDRGTLTPDELSELDRTARRAHAELRSLVNAFPPASRNASELSRQLGVERTTCQRIVSEVTTPYKGPEAAIRLPGVKGMGQFTDAARRHGIRRELVDSADAAIHQLAQSIRAIAGSQSALGRRLQGGPATNDHSGARAASDPPWASDQFLASGVALTGHLTDVSVATLIYRPSPTVPGRLDRAQLRAFLGHRMRRQAMPFSLFWFEDQPESEPQAPPLSFSTLDLEPVEGRSQGVVLPQYSTNPLPLITSRGPASRTILQIDPSEMGDGDPFDLVVAGRSDAMDSNPANDSPPVHEVWKLGRYPERTLIFDVLLHRSMARACIPSIGVYLVSPFLDETQEYRWLDRYPTTPPLQVMPPGLDQMGHPECDRYPEMLGHLFERVGWEPGEFVGYRCAVHNPIFSAGYCMSFDYSSQDTPTDRG